MNDIRNDSERHTECPYVANDKSFESRYYQSNIIVNRMGAATKHHFLMHSIIISFVSISFSIQSKNMHDLHCNAYRHCKSIQMAFFYFLSQSIYLISFLY